MVKKRYHWALRVNRTHFQICSRIVLPFSNNSDSDISSCTHFLRYRFLGNLFLPAPGN